MITQNTIIIIIITIMMRITQWENISRSHESMKTSWVCLWSFNWDIFVTYGTSETFVEAFCSKKCFAVVLIDWFLKLLLWSISSNDEATFPDKTGGARVKWKHMIKKVRSTHRILKWKGFHIILKVLHTATWYITPNFYTKPSQNNHHQHGLLIQRHYDEQNFPYYQPSHNAKPYDQSLTTH